MEEHGSEDLFTLRENLPIWDRVSTVNPLVLVGTKEEDEGYDIAPKAHGLSAGLGQLLRLCLYAAPPDLRQPRREGVFTVTYPRPTQVVLASLPQPLARTAAVNHR